jgi:t-SNARE complex subunit (syntaxin)
VNRINKTPGVVYSNKEKQKENRELISQYDKRINDLLHKIEFTNATPAQAYKMYMKLQGFLRKRRDLKRSGHIYIPRTETGHYIVNGQVTKQKKENL